MLSRPLDKNAPVSKCKIQLKNIIIDSDDSFDSSNEDKWIDTFCQTYRTKHGEIFPSWFCKIPTKKIEYYYKTIHQSDLKLKTAIELITDQQTHMDISEKEEAKFQATAEHIYGLYHAHFILTQEGMKQMCEKYKLKHWGTCPRFHCYQNPVLPYGKSNQLGVHCAQVYCPVCKEVYNSDDKRAKTIDGAYFGPTFAILFCKLYPEICTIEKIDPVYTIHGFRIADFDIEMEATKNTNRCHNTENSNHTNSNIITNQVDKINNQDNYDSDNSRGLGIDENLEDILPTSSDSSTDSYPSSIDNYSHSS
ncbi:casein kinase II beta chain [Tritrichomonas foetus]|uniref:Casein kinase II subunit beta n=1 Tax=Tritrichomonas foetus TaxID=1144522 RepID=A0A1J4KVB8_9EUKA|nr:casein kinase II beta chain [Tritrichomonas foetus]|eukprot:OHT15179.1 casein kinase II beta chain [Tritrichomonas foetus]